MYRLIIICALLLLSVVAAEAETVKLSLRDAISMALVNNNQIKAAGFNSHAASQGIDAANSRYLPVVSFEETFAATNSPTNTFMMKLDEGRFTNNDFLISNLNNPSAQHDFKTALSIQQPLYVPSLSSLKTLAVKDAQKSELELEAARQGIAFQVFYTYLDVQKADAQLKAADKAVGDARENMRIAVVRTSTGVGLRSDELRSRTHLSMVEQQHISAQNNLVLARMKLAMLIGMPEDSNYEISGFSDEIEVVAINDQVVRDALDNRVEIKQSYADLEKSDAALKLAWSGYLPTVGAFASYQLNAKDAPFASDNEAWTAGVSLKWNVFEGFRTNSERRRALSGQSAAREMLESARKDVRYQLKESYVRRDEAAKRLEVTRHSVKDAEETVRLLTRRYENSLATMVELLDAQTALNQTRANLVDAEAGYALAGGRVYYMSGTFVKEILK
ncbi:MAG: TolC family protein [Desulfuromonadaceae bacterium]|nr:TolC family protein [Desulfuromonadaceae bacterium]MDD2848722.1 TolC family protein [Desulfuromonadaceae bacterium]MDD4130372.1 TolC family protein [Desulfuromonadaceae bacterium]